MKGKGVKFERIRRITGYLVGTVERFNDAKRAEEKDRVKHKEKQYKGGVSMANEQNLRPGEYKFTTEDARKGGIASGKARNYKKEQIENLKMLLDAMTSDGKTTYREAMNLGVLKGAINGKAENFKVLMDYLDNNTSNNDTPIVNINIIDNGSLEKALYDEKN